METSGAHAPASIRIYAYMQGHRPHVHAASGESQDGAPRRVARVGTGGLPDGSGEGFSVCVCA